jgi:N-acetylneuraminic acid mutarotase
MSADNGIVRLGRWRRAPSSLEAHLEAASIRVGNTLYVIGGYQTLTQMCTKMQILDVASGGWRYGPPLPDGFPLSHAGVATDGRFLFIVSGQLGPACWPATERSWALDLHTMAWTAIAPLPVARFAPVLAYLDGNLHLVTGTTEDRVTIATEHFIMRVRDRTAERTMLPLLSDQAWRTGPPIPLGGDHAASVVLDSALYVVGGEHGHAPVTMDATRCRGVYWAHPYLFRYNPRREEWQRLADMLFAVSHIESQVLVLDGKILVLGGTGDGDVFSARVQEYDPARDRWREMKGLPQARKGGVVWQTNGSVYFNGGQLTSDGNNRPVVADTIAARIRRGPWYSLFTRGARRPKS